MFITTDRLKGVLQVGDMQCSRIIAASVNQRVQQGEQASSLQTLLMHAINFELLIFSAQMPQKASEEMTTG
jgi:hypothetical protein